MTFTPVSFNSLPTASSVNTTDQTLVVQAGVAKKAPFSALPNAPAGPPGSEGPQGPDGSRIYVGSGAPSSALGVNNDVYIDFDNGDFYQKASATWSVVGNVKGPQGEDGATGAQGDPGSQILFGINAPADILGNDGDLYIDTESGDLFSKDNGTWDFEVNLKGEDGLQFYYDSEVPSSGLGSDNDLYLNTSNGTLLRKESGTWVQIFDFTGSSSGEGLDFQFGTSNPSDSVGNDGDVFVNTTSGFIFKKIDGTWENQLVFFIYGNYEQPILLNPPSDSLDFIQGVRVHYLEAGGSYQFDNEWSTISQVYIHIVDYGSTQLRLRFAPIEDNFKIILSDGVTVSEYDYSDFDEFDWFFAETTTQTYGRELKIIKHPTLEDTVVGALIIVSDVSNWSIGTEDDL